MNLEKVVFGFFIILSATMNLGFVYGDPANPAHHHPYEFFAAIVVNLIATVLKIGDRTQIGAMQLATSLVAVLQLGAAALVWFLAGNDVPGALGDSRIVEVVSLSAGALLANAISVVLLIIETTMQRR